MGGSLIPRSGAQVLADCLERAGVQRIYGIVGTSNIAFVNALYDKRDKIRYISTRHEQVCASMADAEGRMTGRPGVCLTHSGPGTLNATMSIANAYKDCSPVIILSGAVRRALKGSDGLIEADHGKVIDPVCKGTFQVEDLAEMPAVFASAYRLAMTPAKGPVLIDVPENLWHAEAAVDLGSLDLTAPFPRALDASKVEEVFGDFRDSVRPVLLVGAGVFDADATGSVRRLAEKTNVPVVTTGNGRGVIPESHGLCLGRVGFFGNPVADKALEQADLVLGLGCCLSDLITWEYTADLRGKVVIVNADPEAAMIPPETYMVNLEFIAGDAGDFLDAFLCRLDAEPVRKPDSWMDSILPVKERWEAQLGAAISSDKAPLSAGKVVRALSDLAPKDAIFTGGAGLNTLYVNAFTRIESPRSYLAPNNFGAMGFGFPALLAAGIIAPERAALSILGDGDFLMTIQDIETGVREGVVGTVLILNDSSYRALRYTQQILYGGRIYGTEHRNPDFIKLAEAFGAAGYRIETPDQIEPVLKEAMGCGRLAIVDARIDPDDPAPANIEAILKMRGISR
jgi:acetolactate synthase I/II/III large subunit